MGIEDGASPAEILEPLMLGAGVARSSARGSTVLQLGQYAAVRSLLAVVRALSYRASLRLGSAIGTVAWNLFRGLRRHTLRNLELAYGRDLNRAQVERIARGAFDVLGRNITEVSTLASRPYHKLVVENAEALHMAYAKGRGVVLVSAHMGCFARLVAVPSFLGMKGACIMKKQKNSALLDWGRAFMKRVFNMHIILKTEAPEEVATYLRDGRLVGFFADQRPRSGGFPGQFFGQPVMIAPGPAICARRYKAPMVTLTLNSKSDGTQVAQVDAIDTSGSLQELSQRWMGVLERRIREHPEQWMWMHRRWKDLEGGSETAEDPSLAAGQLL